MQIRYDSIRIDKLFIKFYLKEIYEQIGINNSLNDFNTYIRNFKRDFSLYIGSKDVFPTDSGTSALQIALLSLGIKKGDKVLIPAITHPACALATLSLGAKPIFVDVKEDNLTINEELLPAYIDKKVKAVIAVHLYGLSCNMEAINKTALRYNLKVIEDASHALGSTYHGKKLGTFSDLGIFSFSYYKTLASVFGRGGCVITNNKVYGKNIMRALKTNEENILKFNNISFLDLAVLSIKLKKINLIEKTKRASLLQYESGLNDINDIKIFFDSSHEKSIRLFYCIMCKRREELFQYLKQNHVLCELSRAPLYKHFIKERNNSLPISEKYHKFALSLPMFSFMREDEILYVINHIRHFFGLF